jgi:protein SDA1
MSRQQNNPLSRNIPQLQNLIKRDPASYQEEFEQQYRYFESTLQVFKLEPTEYNKTLEEIVMFLAQVAKCYPEQLAKFPQVLVDLLREHSTTIDPDMRMSFCRALILLRHRDLLAPVDLLKLFFDLLKVISTFSSSCTGNAMMSGFMSF